MQDLFNRQALGEFLALSFSVGLSEPVFITKGNHEMLAVVNAGDDWDWVGSLYFY